MIDPREDDNLPEPPPLSRQETKRLMINSVLAALAVAVVFVAGALLFILFCVFFWFRA